MSNIYNAGATVRVMTYNVGGWYTGISTSVPTAQKSEYYALQSGTFTRANADVCMVQEYLKNFCQDGEPAANLMGLFFDDIKTTNQETAYRGHAICTKSYPLSDYQTHLFSNAGDTNYQGYETAKMTVCGKTINLINTHNNYRTSPQAIHMTEVLEAIEHMEYFILCGDFNIDLQTEDKSNVQYLQSVKPFYDRGYNMANFNDRRGWLKTYYATAEATNGKFTDNIVTSANIKIISASIDDTKLTNAMTDKIDHIPIIAELSIL